MKALRRRYGNASGGGGGRVQSLMFPTDRFTVAGAKAWAAKHKWKHDDVDVKADFIHLRQEDPSHFSRIRTQFLGGSGVEARIGWRKP
jgi:hypothetical protein